MRGDHPARYLESALREAAGPLPLRIRSYGTPRRCFTSRPWAALVVQDSESEVVCVFVLVPILKCKDLQNGVRGSVRDPHCGLRSAATVEALAFNFAFDEVLASEIGSTDVESPKLRSCEFFEAEYATGLNRFSLDQELDRRGNAIDVSGPSEAGVVLDEATLSRLFCKVSDVSSPRARLMIRSTPVVPTCARARSGSCPTR